MDWLRKLTGKFSKNKEQDDQEDIWERYGIDERAVKTNPLYGKDMEPEPEIVEHEGRFRESIGGLLTEDAIKELTGGLKDGKIYKHKNFGEALEALNEYQEIMKKPRTMSVDEVRMRRNVNFKPSIYGGAKVDTDDVQKACDAMRRFIVHADHAVKDANGFFTRRSSNVRKLTPVFANMLVNAYSILPKLVHLESAVVQYVIQTDQDQYTFSEVVSNDVTAGRSGGLAMRGVGNENNAIVFSPKKALEAIQSEDPDEAILELRKEQTKSARMGIRIPKLPKGIGEARAEEVANAYIADLRLLKTALDDVAESYEFADDTNERKGVHDRQAEHFRMSRLLSRVIRNEASLKAVISAGLKNDKVKQMSGYQDIVALTGFEGRTLSEAVAGINKEATDESTYKRLVDEKGNELQVEKDYYVGGGATSISILDFHNNRVLRTPKKNDGSYLSDKEQKTALNGIKDEATGKVSQFLGLNIAAQAEAVGFEARDKEGKNPTKIFGGSIMEMAKGKAANDINFVLNQGMEDQIAEKNKGNQTVDIKKQGRLIGDIMKMNVLDYIVQHGDRNGGNFLINMDAGENESMVTAIDNDMVLGYDQAGRFTGQIRSIDAVGSINNRMIMDFGFNLQAAFPMMTQELIDKLTTLNEDDLNYLLMPYADRISRMTAVHRAKELKAYAQKLKEDNLVCDLSTEKGTEQFLSVAVKAGLTEWLRTMKADDFGFGVGTRGIPSTLLRMLLNGFNLKADFMSKALPRVKDMIKAMRVLGVSKEEAKELIMKNISSSDKDEPLTEEQFKNCMKGQLYEEWEKYDQQ